MFVLYSSCRVIHTSCIQSETVSETVRRESLYLLLLCGRRAVCFWCPMALRVRTRMVLAFILRRVMLLVITAVQASLDRWTADGTEDRRGTMAVHSSSAPLSFSPCPDPCVYIHLCIPSSASFLSFSVFVSLS